jgi:hypothetical protein
MWKKIKDYENYEINELGQVRRDNKILKEFSHTNNYLFVTLCKKGKARSFRIHRLLAEAFIPNPENKAFVNHKDGNRRNNTLSNLEWVTSSENNLHAYHVTKTRKPPRSMLGRFAEKHNRSVPFSIKYPDGRIVRYGSGLEFTRLTGLDHSTISYGRISGKRIYHFKRGKVKGLTVYYENH